MQDRPGTLHRILSQHVPQQIPCFEGFAFNAQRCARFEICHRLHVSANSRHGCVETCVQTCISNKRAEIMRIDGIL